MPFLSFLYLGSDNVFIPGNHNAYFPLLSLLFGVRNV